MIRLGVVLVAVIVAATTASHLGFLSLFSVFDRLFLFFLDFMQYGSILEHLDKFLTVTIDLIECLDAILCLDRFPIVRSTIKLIGNVRHVCEQQGEESLLAIRYLDSFARLLARQVYIALPTQVN